MTMDAAAAAIGLATGFLAGLIHFASLWWNIQLFTAGAAGRAWAAQLARIAVAGAALAMLSRLGASGLLFGGLGLLLARPLALWRLGALR